MKHNRLINWALFAVSATCLAFTAPVFAAKDTLYVSTTSNVTVGGSSATFSADSGVNTDRHMTLDADVIAGSSVSMTVNWAIDRGIQMGAITVYPRSMNFSSSTTVTPGPAVAATISGSPCAVSAYTAATACSTGISFPTPATPGDYQVLITPADSVSSPGNVRLEVKLLYINFTVVEPVVEKEDTVLTVEPKCVLYKAGDVQLTATLEELASGDKIPDANVDFYVDPPSTSIGSDSTNANGVAVLSYNIDSLTPGDHNLYAEFLGDTIYNPSNDSANLGVSYNFVGFQQPINADGTSVFGNGRVIPIKIKITDANLDPVTDAAPTVWVTKVSPSTALGDELEPASSVSAADTGNTMRYDFVDNHYIYNWDLTSLTNGTWYVVVNLGDSDACSSGPYYATITVSKKGKK